MSAPIDQLTASLADRYRVVRELGAGGMATVYLAEDLKHDRRVAIKVLRPELAAIIGAERFLREIKTIASLQHPHILGLIDSGEISGVAFYVMPYVDGESLRDRLQRERQLPIADVIRISSEIASALDYAHRHGVVHRDIKPENILLHDGQALVADFGIALAASAAGGTRMTETGMSLGTPHYMSPEQAMGEREITARSDVYALGCVLYEMLVGEPPFTGPTAQAIVAKVVTDDVRPPSQLRKTVPAVLDEVVTTALQKLPADRYESAAAFARALTQPSGAGTVRTSKPSLSWWSDSRSRIALACTIAAVALAAFAWIRPSRSSSLGRARVHQLTFEIEGIFNARFAPDGKTVVYAAAPTAGSPRLYIIRPESMAPEAIGPDSANLLSISSTGEIALLTHAVSVTHKLFSGTLARMPLGGGAPREVIENVFDADWTPDGKELAVARIAENKLRVEFPLGHVVYTAGTGYISDLRISPDGERLAFFEHVARGDDAGYVVVVSRSGAPARVTDFISALEGLAWERDGHALMLGASFDLGGRLEVTRLALDGRKQPEQVFPALGDAIFHDLSAANEWLITRVNTATRMAGRLHGATEVSDISWRDQSLSTQLSRDGTLLAFTDQSELAGSNYSVMLRKADASTPARLGEGSAVEISRDNKWVLGSMPFAPLTWKLHPIGAGESRELHWLGMKSIGSVAFTGDGSKLVVCGVNTSGAQRCHLSPLDASSLTPITPDSSNNARISPDGSTVAFRWRGDLYTAPLAGGAPRQIPGHLLGRIDRWTADGKALIILTAGQPAPVFSRVEVATGIRSDFARIDVPRQLQASRLFNITVSDDPNVYAFAYQSYTSLLFRISGVK